MKISASWLVVAFVSLLIHLFPPYRSQFNSICC